MEFKHPKEDYSNLDESEFKTPRRSVRLRSNTTTPASTVSTVKKVLIERRSTKLSQTKLNMPKPDSTTKKRKPEILSESSAEKTQKNNSKKGKKRKGKKSRNGRNKNKSTHATIEMSLEKDIMNVTFDKLSSGNSDEENKENGDNIKSRKNSTTLSPLLMDIGDNINSKTNSTTRSPLLMDFTSTELQEQKKLRSSSTVSLNNTYEFRSSDSNEDLRPEENASSTEGNVALQDDNQSSVNYEKVEEPSSSSDENVNVHQGPLASGYVLSTNIEEDAKTKTDSTVSLNFSGIKLLSDTDSSVNIPQNSFSEEKHISSSNPSEDVKELEKLETINENTNLNECKNKDVLSPKTPLLKKTVEKVISSTPIMRPLSTLATPKSVKRLQTETPKLSDSKSNLKKSIANRVSTPFHKAANKDKQLDSLKRINVAAAKELLTSSIVTPIRTVEKVQKPLRSIRKRSLSESCTSRKLSRVTFHSPSNKEIPIDDIDVVMKKNVTQGPSLYVTQRRKRSLSVTETELEKNLAFATMNLEANEDPSGTPSKLKKLPVPTSRTKMPNFAAIHQQKFQKMESIADHVARKVERAKNLTLSTTKAASVVKATQIKNDVKKVTETKAANKTTNKIQIAPKARQKIDLSLVEDKKLQSAKATHNASKVVVANDSAIDKVKSRQKKNIELYKSRINQKDKDSKKQEIVKGVRSNRRFELQMMCRNRVD